MNRLLPTLVALLALAVTLPAQGETVLKSGDVKKFSKPFGEWLEARLTNDPESAGEALGDLDKAMTSVTKKLKGRDPLSLVADWEIVLQQGRKFETNGKLMARGKVANITFPSGIETLVRMPLKYTPGKVLYPTIVLLGQDARAALEELEKGIADPFIVIMPDITDLDAAAVAEVNGFTRIAGPIGQASLYYGVDRRRLFLVALDDQAAEVTRQLAAEVPNYFAGMVNFGKQDDTAFPGSANLKIVPQPEATPASLAEGMAWCEAQVAMNPYPTEFEYEIAVPWQGRAYWVQAVDFDSDAAEGTTASRFKVSVDRESNTINLDSTGIYRVRIFLSDALLDLDRPIVVMRNGESYTYQASRSMGALLSNFGSTLDRSVFPAMISSLDIPQPSDSKEAEGAGPAGN